MKKTIQRIIQIVFLTLFVMLFFKGKVQAWAVILLLGIIASFILGRFYCGWVCSINTVLAGVTWLKKKLHIKNASVPKFFLKSWVRYMVLGLFIAAFLFTAATGKKLPILPALFAIGILITLVYPEELWHRYLCPYGMLLSLSSLSAKHGMQVDEALCIGCGVCKQVCPSKAVEKSEAKYKIHKSDCLVCIKCETHCKKSAICYK